jgi:hypothetical protein
MYTPGYYHEMAERYAAEAMRAKDPQIRASLVEMAQYALQLAEQAAASQEAAVTKKPAD